MNKRLGQTVVTTGTILLLAAGAQAAELSYDYVELRWVNADIDVSGAGDIDGDGIDINGSFTIAENVHVFAGFQTLDFDFGVDTTALQIGAGYMQPIAPTTDFVARLAYVDGELDVGTFDFDDSGFGLSVGLRHEFAPQIQAGAFINHVDLDESGDETSFELRGEYFLNDQFSAGLTLEFGDDTTVWAIGGRYYFGAMRR